ncbi:MAG: LysM peptidoglycan-binding domain-containing protein [Chloroflexi bacterium]|nr:LysM peptidoglycan-binding domain-containing protein [Chloroflexota bacterium]
MSRVRFLLPVLLAILLTATLIVSAQGGTNTYTVETGDVLDLIAAAFDVDTACLAETNDLSNPNELTAGQVLLISFDCPRYSGYAFVANPRDGGEQDEPGQGGGGDEGVQPGPGDETYTVERGDTLDTIGQALNISVISLQAANGLADPNQLMAGDVLIIPADAPAYGQYPPLVNPLAAAGANMDVELGQGGGAPAGPGDELYVVQPRDVLDLIGASFDKQAACIAEYNNLADANLLYAGLTLVIPVSCPPYDGLAFVSGREDGS